MKSVFISLVLSICLITPFINARELGIIPQPVSQSITNEKYILKDGTDIYINTDNKELNRLAEVLSASLHKRTCYNFNIKKGNADKGIILETGNKNIKTDGYELTITNNLVKLSANTDTGIFYGIQTLTEILKQDNVIYFPGCKIKDYPRYSFRGFSFDGSRHFQSVAVVKKVIKVMSLLKMNVFHWHLVDDEGWRIESKKFPQLNKIGSYRDSLNSKQRNGYYTIEEIKEVIQYAKEHYIKVIPEVEMPGHSRAIMDSYPELLCPTNKNGNTYCAGNENTYRFMKAALKEVIDIFGTDVIHVGGDERPEGVWEKCPVCKEMIAKHKLADENMLQNYFMKDICDYVSTLGVNTIAWFANIKDGIPKNQIVEAWHPGEAWESARAGDTTINTDCVFTYFDYPNNEYEKQFKPKWMPVLTLEKVYSFNPTPDTLTDNEKKLIIGSECAIWTEIIFEDDIQYQIFPRILAYAEDVWTPLENKNYEKFVKRAESLQPYLRSIGFEYDNGEKIINGK